MIGAILLNCRLPANHDATLRISRSCSASDQDRHRHRPRQGGSRHQPGARPTTKILIHRDGPSHDQAGPSDAGLGGARTTDSGKVVDGHGLVPCGQAKKPTTIVIVGGICVAQKRLGHLKRAGQVIGDPKPNPPTGRSQRLPAMARSVLVIIDSANIGEGINLNIVQAWNLQLWDVRKFNLTGEASVTCQFGGIKRSAADAEFFRGQQAIRRPLPFTSDRQAKPFRQRL
ncbi:hypothetical protein WCLP8_4350002 [uncultured Gammaproteobacteria bacterium]